MQMKLIIFSGLPGTGKSTLASRLARELHDETGQALTAVKLNLQALKQRSSDLHLSARLEDSIGIFKELSVQSALLSYETVVRIVASARRHGLPVFAHVTELSEAEDAVRAGVRGLMHSVAGIGESPLRAQLRSAGIYYAPTLRIFWGFDSLRHLERLDDPFLLKIVSRGILIPAWPHFPTTPAISLGMRAPHRRCSPAWKALRTVCPTPRRTAGSIASAPTGWSGWRRSRPGRSSATSSPALS